MNWKLKENIRLNKTCSTCRFGTVMTHDNTFELCMYDMEHTSDVVNEIDELEISHQPSVAPRIKTCEKWEPKN